MFDHQKSKLIIFEKKGKFYSQYFLLLLFIENIRSYKLIVLENNLNF